MAQAAWCSADRLGVRAGAKKREEIYAAFEAIYPVLQEFRKGDVEAAPRLPPVAQAPQLLQAPQLQKSVWPTPLVSGTNS